MLVLSRKHGQRIVLHTTSGDVWVTVVQIEHGKVRLGFEAAESVTILREELLSRFEKDAPDR